MLVGRLREDMAVVTSDMSDTIASGLSRIALEIVNSNPTTPAHFRAKDQGDINDNINAVKAAAGDAIQVGSSHTGQLTSDPFARPSDSRGYRASLARGGRDRRHRPRESLHRKGETQTDKIGSSQRFSAVHSPDWRVGSCHVIDWTGSPHLVA